MQRHHDKLTKEELIDVVAKRALDWVRDLSPVEALRMAAHEYDAYLKLSDDEKGEVFVAARQLFAELKDKSERNRELRRSMGLRVVEKPQVEAQTEIAFPKGDRFGELMARKRAEMRDEGRVTGEVPEWQRGRHAAK